MQPILDSIIKCPNCSHEQQEVMPTDACLFFLPMYELSGFIKAQKRRLLCFLFLWIYALPTYTSWTILLP